MSKGDDQIWQGIQFLRGVAISLVLSFHIFFGLVWSEVPFISNSPLGFGYLGVQLFFMISGFVISKSLVNARTLKQFLLRRYVRLIPALILILPTLYFLSVLIPQSPFKKATTVPNLLTSLSLVSPEIINRLVGTHLENISGVIWSLNAEIAFYVLAGTIFFLSRNKFTNFYFCLLSLSTLISSIGWISSTKYSHTVLEYSNSLIIAFRLQHLPWFCLGVWLYRKTVSGNGRTAKFEFAMLIILVFECINVQVSLAQLSYLDLIEILHTLMIIIVFLIIAPMRFLRNNMLVRVLISIGNVSYEFYLFHYGAIIPVFYLLVDLGDSNSASIYLVYALVLSAYSFVVSRLIYRVGTQPISKYLRQFIQS